MKKVLIVSYYFPPSGGPGVQRVLKFVKYLPSFGYEPSVLTVADGDFPAVDESLLKSIPEGAKVYRTKIFEPYGIYRKLTGKKRGAAVDVENIPSGKKRGIAEKISEFIRSTFFIPDARIGWYPYALRKGLDIVKKEKIDILYSSSPPYTSAVIAGKLQAKTGIPWVMGLRDPWTGFISAPKRWFIPAAIDRRMERNSISNAKSVDVAWEGIGTDLQNKYPDLDKSKLEYIPNGFDSEDYPAIEKTKNKAFTITYTGSLYGKRNPRLLLDAITRLKNEGRIQTDKLRLVFAGRFGAEVREMFEHPELRGMIEVKEYVPHEESIRLLLRSDLLALIVDESPLSREIVPGKVFEYIGSRNPIIAFAPDGAAARIIRSTGSGIVVGPGDLDAAMSAIMAFYLRFIGDREAGPGYGGDFKPVGEAIMAYDRKEATRKLALLFTKILERNQ